MAETNPFAEFAPKAPASAQPAANPFAEFAPAKQDDGLDAQWQAVQTGKARFSSLPKEVQDSLVRRYAPSNAANSAVQGIMSNFGDEATAGVNALLETVGLGKKYAGQSLGERYEDYKAFNNAQLRSYEKDNPKTDMAAKLAGGISTAALMPAVAPFKGAAMLPSMANAGATGLAYGALAGAGEGDTLKERGLNSLVGGGLGMGIGAAAVPVSRGIGNAVGFLADQWKGVPAPLRQYERGALKNVVRGLADDGIPADDLAFRAASLGPEGMMADMGTAMRNRAVGASVTPGPGQAVVNNAVRARADQSLARIQRDMDLAMGPAQNVPELLEQIQKRASTEAKPFYDTFRDNPVPFTQGLEETLEILKNEPSVLRAARRYANLDAPDAARQFFANIADDGTVAIQRVPNATEWDYIKRGLDALSRTSDANDQRIYGALAKRLRSSIDDALTGTPSEGAYARAREIAGEGFGLREALELGQTALKRGVSPDQLAMEMRGLSDLERQAQTIGLRSNLRDTMANAATKWGQNGDTEARRLLNSPAAQQKVRMTVGDAPAETLLSRIERENTFDRLSGALAGSNSINKVAAKETVPQPAGNLLPGTTQSSAFGTLIAAPVMKMANAVTRGAIDERNARITADIARLVTATGQGRDQLMAPLRQYMLSRGMSDATRDTVSRMTQRLLEGTRAPAIDRWAPYQTGGAP